jgi:multiple sugar transport system substrate-binding protein
MLNKIANHEVDRRLVLKGAAAGGLGIAGATMLAGCASGTGPISFGARTVDAGS